MPKNCARKRALAQLKNELNIKHADAIQVEDHPDEDERRLLVEYLSTYSDITTYKAALAHLRREQELDKALCETCGWTNRMVCPECPGCGCYNGRCSGWRHSEYQAEMDSATGDYDPDDDPNACPECGAGGSGDPYGECCCYEDEEQVA